MIGMLRVVAEKGIENVNVTCCPGVRMLLPEEVHVTVGLSIGEAVEHGGLNDPTPQAGAVPELIALVGLVLVGQERVPV